jgi:uncharacterized membrane protein YbhN (UPF0104 family)
VITLSHKSKQYLLASLKLFIVGITFSYIYVKLTQSNTLNFTDFTESFTQKNDSISPIFLFVTLAAFNWFFEILKWKTVTSVITPLSFKTAMKQSLASLTVSLTTPNRIGDYGAKAFFFIPKERKQILLLNFFSNATQMAVTCLLGCAGLFFVVTKYGISFSTSHLLVFLGGIVLLTYLGYRFKEKRLLLKGLSVAKVIKYFKNISPQIKTRVLGYSLARYVCFSILFFVLLRFFGVGTPFQESMLIIFTMYLLASLIPTIFIFDVVVRGGVAVWLFSLAGVPELPVLSTVLAMWILNFVIPSIWGSVYVLTYKTRLE